MWQVTSCAVFIGVGAASLTFLFYLCAGAWKLVQRMKRLETKLMEADAKIISLIATLDMHIKSREPAGPDLQD